MAGDHGGGKVERMLINFREHQVSDFASLVSAYSSKELASPTRSTVPLLAFWAQPEARLAEFSGRLGLAGVSQCQLCFEYPVPVQQGSGKSSFTDLMILSESAAVAIEAKFTEPEYETVETWLRTSASQNRQAVLAGWLQLIARAIGIDLNASAVAGYPYQLVHRTASACHPRASHRWVVYQLFSEKRLSYYRNHLANLSRALGGQSVLRFGVLATYPEVTPEYVSLTNRWDSKERDLSDDVRKGLLSGGFFKFRQMAFTELGRSGGKLGAAG